MSIALQAGLFAAGIAVGVAAASSAGKPSSSKKGPQQPAPNALDRSSSPALPPVTSSSSALLPLNTLQELRHGFPGPISDVLKRTAYVAAYDRQKKHPAWTAEHLTAANLKRPEALPPPIPATGTSTAPGYAEALIGKQADRQQIPAVDRSNSTFKEDVDVPPLFRAKLEDYFRSGYDRGHMVPAADAKRSQVAMDETFLLTNIAPQVGEGFNRHYWAYAEDFCRRLTGSFSDVYVFTIPLYLPRRDADGKYRVTYEVIGAQSGGIPSVAVPTHFAKVVLGARPSSPSTPTIPETSIGAFVLPNAVIPDDVPFESFKVPVEAVEKAAGLTLFDDATKVTSKELCRVVKCDIIVRKFDDANKRIGGKQGGRGGK